MIFQSVLAVVLLVSAIFLSTAERFSIATVSAGLGASVVVIVLSCAGLLYKPNRGK
jgi:hypothetical protein